MFKAGIIDPVKVVRTALSATPPASPALMLTTEALVTNIDKEDKDAAGRRRRAVGSVRVE